MKLLKRHITIAFLIGIMLISGCADQLDSILPRDQIAQNQLSESDITKVQNGVYAAMEELVFRYYFDGDIRGESFRGGPGFALNDPVSMAPGSSDILQMWQRSFTYLKQVNFLIDTYEKSSNKQSEIIKKAGGEAYYFRALIYYTMVIRWGKLPIVDRRTNEVIPLSSEEKVWKFIESDLKSAEALLPEFTDKYYVSQSANNALFAKMYLSLNNYPKAIEYADKVISKSNFELASTSEEYASPFIVNTNSKEIVFALVNQRTSGLLLFYQSVNDTDPTWNYAPETDLYNALYDDNAIKSEDIRKPAVFSSTDNSRVMKFPNGLEGQFIHNAVASQTPIVVTRVAEMYLIKAEAQGNTTEGRSTLLQFMNKRYQQVSLGNMSDLEYQNLILDERYREFYGEGFRWYDLKRTGRLDLFKSLNGRNHLMYYPVPQNEIDLAGKENYPQNEGYGN